MYFKYKCLKLIEILKCFIKKGVQFNSLIEKEKMTRQVTLLLWKSVRVLLLLL